MFPPGICLLCEKQSITQCLAVKCQGANEIITNATKSQTEKQITKKMRIKPFTCLLIALGLFLASNANSQVTTRKDSSAYVYFEEKMRAENEVSTYKLDFGEYDVFVFEVWEPRKRTLYTTFNKHKYRLVDSVFVQNLSVQPSDWLIDISNFAPDQDLIKSKKYNQVFILEKTDENTYKMIEIVGYIGDIFFAPERRKNK